MTLDDKLKESSAGTVVESLTNDEYKKMCVEETDPVITLILKDYSSALRDAGNYYVR